jgi:hypothetical protein
MANQPSANPRLNPVLTRPRPIVVPTGPRVVRGPSLTKPRIFTPGIGLNLGT